MVKRYFWFVLISLDQLLNVLFGGYPDETLSSRMGKRPDCKVCRFMCKLLDLVDKDHCQKAIEYDEGNKHNKH